MICNLTIRISRNAARRFEFYCIKTRALAVIFDADRMLLAPIFAIADSKNFAPRPFWQLPAVTKAKI
jgi:hypothetical protein